MSLIFLLYRVVWNLFDTINESDLKIIFDIGIINDLKLLEP